MNKPGGQDSGYDGNRQINMTAIIGGLCSFLLLFCVTLAPRPPTRTTPAPYVMPSYLFHFIGTSLPARWQARGEATGTIVTWRSRDGLDTVQLDAVVPTDAESEATPEPGITVQYEADSCGGYDRMTAAPKNVDGKLLLSQGYETYRADYRFSLTIAQLVHSDEQNEAKATAAKIWEGICQFL